MQPVSRCCRTTSNHGKLRLIFTSDVHGHLLGYDYLTDTPDPTRGLARLAPLIENLRTPDHCCLLLDGGDSLQGTPLVDLAADQNHTEPSAELPTVTLMNAMGFDAASLGNHDFGFGLAHVERAIAQSRFPWLCANLRKTAPASTPFTPPSVLLTRPVPGADRPVRIGLFGVLPPQVIEWEAAALGTTLGAEGIVDAAKAATNDLKAQGAEIIVALCHSGISESEDAAENAAVEVAALTNVNVVLCGHTHQAFPGPDISASARVDPVIGTLCGKPAVMPSHSAQCVGVIDLDLQFSDGAWTIAGQKARLLAPKAAVVASPALHQQLADAHAVTLAHIRRPVGHLPDPLNSFLTAVGDDKALRLVAEAQRRFVEQALAGHTDLDVPVLSATAPLKAGGHGGTDNFTDVAAGMIRQSGIADLYPFPNRIAAVRMTGAGLRAWLERSAGWYRQLDPKYRDQPLLDPAFSAYNADVIHGLSYELDLTRPALYSAWGEPQPSDLPGRVVNLTCGGGPVMDTDEFIVATNSYRAHGGGRFPGLKTAEKLSLPDADIHTLLANHIASGDRLYGNAPPAWRFTACPRASAVFETNVKAEAFLHEAAPKLTVIGQTARGGLRLRVEF